jgi:F-type H+-transporting ATPase subunit beta
MDEVSEVDKRSLWAGRRVSIAFLASCSSSPSGSPALKGKIVPLERTIRSFKEVVQGQHDDLPEQAFYVIGGIDRGGP